MVTTGYLNTRGRERHRDYQFIGPAPATTWWRAYAEHTTFERPTVLVQSDGRSWQAYLSGIPSRRRDAVGTVIRYTVVVEGGAEPSAEPPHAELGTGDVLALVANWLADQDLDRGVGRVSAALDDAFPEPDVERLLTTAPTGSGSAEPESEPTAVDVGRRLGAALHSLRLPAPDDTDLDAAVAPDPWRDDWLADVHLPAARSAFVQRVDALLSGQAGRALVLNLVGTAEDLHALAADPHPLAVLAPDLPDPATTVPLNRPPADAAPAKKAPPPPGTSRPELAVQTVRGCLRLILVPIALLMALALALFGTLFYLR